QVRSHRLGTAAQEDAILLEESDHWATLELSRSRDGSAVMIRSASPRGSEVWIADLEDPEAAPRAVTGRRTGAPTALVEDAAVRARATHLCGVGAGRACGGRGVGAARVRRARTDRARRGGGGGDRRPAGGSGAAQRRWRRALRIRGGLRRRRRAPGALRGRGP